MGKKIEDKIEEEVAKAKLELYQAVDSISSKVEGNCNNTSRLVRVIETNMSRLEKVARTAGQQSANNVLKSVGLDDPNAGEDIKEIRAYHKKRRRFLANTLNTIWTLFVRIAVIALLGAIFMQQRGFKITV
jgi:hypothetical protein